MTAPLTLKAVVLDWAGTVVDFGSRAPMGAFVAAFAKFGVPLTIAEARGPMGLPKRAHIAALLKIPHVASAWTAAQGSPADDAAIDRVFDVFVPMNADVVADFADFIPGALETIAALRARGLKIGSTTGYTRDIMARLSPVAAKAGYVPDNLVCAGDLADGRPTPLMMYRAFADLGVYPPAAVVKVDDTEPGIAEAIAAGSWAVGVAVSGNALGLSLEEAEAMRASDRPGYDALCAAAAAKLKQAGAHVVIETLATLMPVVDGINRRLAAGETP